MLFSLSYHICKVPTWTLFLSREGGEYDPILGAVNMTNLTQLMTTIYHDNSLPSAIHVQC